MEKEKKNSEFIKSFLPTSFFFFFPLPVAYGNSQARGQIRATAEAYTTAMATLDHYPLSEARIVLASSQRHQVLNPLSHKGNSVFSPTS